jgi:hypothetical protein
MLGIVNDLSDTASICDLTWEQIWFLTMAMIDISFNSKNAERCQHADQMIEILDAIAEQICDRAETDPEPFERLNL